MSSTSTKQRRPRRSKNKRLNINALQRSSFLAYLETIIVDSRRGRKINGYYFDQTRNRCYYRWSQEGSTPDLFSADRWLAHFEVHIDQYFHFCQEHNLPAWAHGEPDWHRLCSDVGPGEH